MFFCLFVLIIVENVLLSLSLRMVSDRKLDLVGTFFFKSHNLKLTVFLKYSGKIKKKIKKNGKFYAKSFFWHKKIGFFV